MPNFRKKPVVIEAMQWDPGPGSGTSRRPTSSDLMARWLNDNAVKWRTVGLGDKCVILLPTLEGTMRAEVGDWIIQGVKGEFYPCKPAIFAATYEEVEDL